MDASSLLPVSEPSSVPSGHDGRQGGRRRDAKRAPSVMSSLSRISAARIAKTVKAEFEDRPPLYYQERQLTTKSLQVWHLWALAFGFVSSGASSFWNGGLVNGWGNVMVCTAISTLYAWCFALIMCEMMR
ncbi:hypothetical protein HK101_006586 [Irineochytrium annulatum]|nr:hypothetical protein HK101_006586 [Irineochytrium annulatum]